MPSPLKILILEDNLLDAQLEISILEQAGFDCEWNRIETKLEFLNFLANPSSYDLVLADYNLPNFDGLTALKLFTKCNLDIPFIIVSGSSGEELAVESVKIGATDYVLKDRLSRLEMVVKRALLEVQDRRARVRAEQELYKLSRAVEYSPSLIMIADLEGKIEYVNPKFTQLTGYSQEEVLGQNRNILRSYSAAAGNDQAPQSLIKDEWQGEVYNKKKDGSFFWASCSISKIKDPSGQARPVIS
jgi:PAS domain S-box-containing protein